VQRACALLVGEVELLNDEGTNAKARVVELEAQ